MCRRIESAFQEIDLPAPEVSGRWASRLQEREPWLFCTGDPPKRPLNDFESFADDALTGSIAAGLMIGWQGYGVNNWAMHYYLIEEDLVVLIQRSWGNIYSDQQECRNSIASTFASLSKLFLAFRRAHAADVELPGRLTVLDKNGEAPRWNYVTRPSPSIKSDLPPSFLMDWNTSDDALTSAAEDLGGRMCDRGTK